MYCAQAAMTTRAHLSSHGCMPLCQLPSPGPDPSARPRPPPPRHIDMPSIRGIRLSRGEQCTQASSVHDSTSMRFLCQCECCLQCLPAAQQCGCADRLCCLHRGLGHAPGCCLWLPLQHKLQQGLCGSLLPVPLDHLGEGRWGFGICHYR